MSIMGRKKGENSMFSPPVDALEREGQTVCARRKGEEDTVTS